MTQSTSPSSASPHRGRRILSFIISVGLVVAGFTALTTTTTAEPAVAATTGAGRSGITPYGGYLGNYIAPDGTRVYCMDSSRDWPSSTTDGGTVTSALTTDWGSVLSPVAMQKLNYALLKYGDTADPNMAAGVSAYVYSYTSTYARDHGAGYYSGAHYIDGDQAVIATYTQVFNDAETNYALGTIGSAQVSIEMANPIDGAVRISTTPAGATGTLALSGAVVTATGSTSVSVSNGALVPITGTPADGDEQYTISAEASFTATAGAAPSLSLYTTGSQQRTIRGGYNARLAFSGSDQTEPISLVFTPVVQTQVASVFVEEGQPFIDGVLASVSGTGQWRTLPDGSGMPVVATGTLYGPFSEQPTVSAEPPADAPIVGSETIALTGPGNYSSPGSLVAAGSGFYTWVWRIDASAQAEQTAALLPDGYSFADEFGLVAETHVVPLRLAVISQVTHAETGFGGEVGDTLTVALAEGVWLTENGVPVPARFEGTAYFVAGDAAPAVSDSVPDGATVLGTATVEASGPGTFPASSTVRAPSATAGYISWVWSLSSSSSHASYFVPWTDQFGLPAETTRVAPPTVSTQAVAAVAVGDEVHDTALVGGVLPAEASALAFEAFLQPSGGEPLCDDSTRVFDSHDNLVTVTSVGSYDSPSTRFERYGTYFWIESLYNSAGELLHRGECGAPGETTLVAPGEVKTLAMPASRPGELAHDVAMVEGLIPKGATLEFAAYRQDREDGPLCTAATRVFESDQITVDGAGTYTSPSTRFEETGTYFWVETLRDRNGDALHIGECGAEGETTIVSKTSLAATGVPTVQPVLVGLGCLGLGVLAVALVAATRRTSRP